MLLRQGHDVTVVDNLSKGYRHNVPAERLHELDLADTQALASLLREKECEAVIHFAAFIAVGESMREPARYFRNNVCGSLSLFDAMVQAGDDSFLIAQGRAHLWSPAGYTKAARVPRDAKLLTPPSTVRAFSAGYRPVLHPSAGYS